MGWSSVGDKIMKNVFLGLSCVLLLCSTAYSAPTASRTSGVAPLIVHFDADAAASTTGSQPFHDLDYTWNFGDYSSGTWSTSGKSKNTDKGPISAHVYETAGTYTATLTIKNPNTGATTSTSSFTITVTNPDTVFASTATTCISTGSDFTGCPSGAAQVTTSNISDLSSYVQAGERLLFRRGDTWSTAGGTTLNNNTGPVHIGAFGTCTNHDSQGICSNAPLITVTSNNSFINLTDKNDWRITDISLSASKSLTSSTTFNGEANIKHVLLSRIGVSGFGMGISLGSSRAYDTDYYDVLSIVGSKVSGMANEGVYIGSERFVFIGNIVENSDYTHVVRVWQAYKSVISHNIISGASTANANGRQALKLHGPKPRYTCSNPAYIDQATCEANGGTWGASAGTSAAVGTLAETGSSGLRYFTQKTVVANNVFGSSGPWPVSIGPQNVVEPEQLSDIIFEKNRLVNAYGTKSGNNSDQVIPVQAAGRYFSIRNNILDGSGTNGDYWGIRALREGGEWTPLGHKIFNNTIYHTGTVTNGPRGIYVTADVSSSQVRNNYISFPNVSGAESAVVDSGSNTVSNNVITKTPHFVDPTNATPLSRNFAITASATLAIDQGYTVPLSDDYIGNCRTGLTYYDVGAYEYGASACTAGYAQVSSGSGGFMAGGSGSFQQ